MTTRCRRWMGLLLALMLTVVLAASPPAAHASWEAGPNEANWPWVDDSGWVTPICGDGWCSTRTLPVAGLFEYWPHRVEALRNAGPAPEYDVGGDPTFVARPQCRYRGIAQGWSAGTWRHYAFWTWRSVGGAWRWVGPTSPHWQFAPGDICGETTNPTRTPPSPTPAPSGGGASTVRVEAAVVGELPEGLGGAATARGGGTYPVGAWVDAAVDVPESWTGHARWGGVTVSGCGMTEVGRRAVRFAAPPGGCTLRFFVAFTAWTPACAPVGRYPRPIPLVIRPAPGASVVEGGAVLWEAPQAPAFLLQDGNAAAALQWHRRLIDDPLVRARAVRLSGGDHVDIILRLGATRRNGGGGVFGAFFEEGGAGGLTVGIIDLGPQGEGPPRLPFWLHAGRESAFPWVRDDGTKVIGYGTALHKLYLDGRAWHDLPDGGRPPEACRNDPACAPTYTPFPNASAFLIGPQTFAAWNADHRKWEHQLWRGGAPPPPEFLPGVQPNFAVRRVWMEPATDLGVRLNLTPGHHYAVIAVAEAKACNEHYYAYTVARIGAEGRPIMGQVRDVTDPDSPAPANRRSHTVTLEATVGGLTRVLGWTTTDDQARFALTVSRAALDRLLRDAGWSPTGESPVQLRLRLVPDTTSWDGVWRYLPTQRPARAPDGTSPDSASPTDVAWTLPLDALLARDWNGATFDLARYPQIGAKPDAQLCLHLRHADRDAAWQTTCRSPTPAQAAWLYGAWLEWRPDLLLALPPTLPPEAQGYTVRWEVQRWTFHGSPPLLTAGASYAAAAPTRTLWSKHPPDGADGWVIRLPSLREGEESPLEVTIDYTYRLETPDGVASSPMHATYRGALAIMVLAPQGTAP